MSVLSPIYTDNVNGTVTLTASALSAQITPQIKIVKQSAATLVLRRRTELLRNVDYMETQIGRLAKMARDMRAEILLLTTE
jgi:hypothetical protein